MRKYLFVAANEFSNWGGSELLWSQAAEKLARRGNEVRVSVKDFGNPMEQVERVRAAGARIFYRRPLSFLSRQIRKVFPLTEYFQLHIKSAGKNADLVVISQGSTADGLAWTEAAHAAGLKYVLIVQGMAEHWWPDDTTADRLALAYESATCVYFVSQATLDLCRRQFASRLRSGMVIRNPFNVSYEARPSWPVNSKGLALACVARLDASTKAHDILFRVLALPHWRARDVALSLVGDGLCERGLRRFADDLSLKDIHFLGHQNDIEAVWKNHHALVLPSRFEGMPLTVVEAMLCARPCIATDVGGNRELIRDGINGFLAKAATVELLDEAMNRAWENRHRLREMGDAAAADVRKWVSADPAEDFVRDLLSLTEAPTA